MKKSLLTGAVIAAMTVAGASAATLDFSYNNSSQEGVAFGVQSKVAYDVAIRIDDPELVGKKILSLEVPVQGVASSIGDVKGWLTTKLEVKDGANVADICTKEGTLTVIEQNTSTISVTFDEPYTITEEGVYVGYSFNVTALTQATQYPVVVAYNNNLNGCFCRASAGMTEWTNMNNNQQENLGVSSAMVVKLEGDFAANAAAASLGDQYYASKGEKPAVDINVFNYGTNAISSMEYTAEAGGKSVNGKLDFAEAIRAQYGFLGTATLPETPVVDEPGEYTLTVTITKINGETLATPVTATSKLSVMSFLPVNRPLVEEFTGLGCPACPLGYCYMELAPKYLGENFVGLAYHDSYYESQFTPNMVIMSSSSYPVNVQGFPSASINRNACEHVSYMYDNYPAYADALAPVGIDVKANWSDAENTVIKAEASYKFVSSLENHGYALSFVLSADGLKNDKWIQSNGINGIQNPTNDDLWNVFTKGTGKIKGLTFNDVVVSYKTSEIKKGIAGSIPASIEGEKEYTYTYEFDTEKIQNTRKKKFVNNGATFRVVAMIIDTKTGKVVNCAKSTEELICTNGIEPNDSGVDGIGADNEVSVRYYDLNGMEVAAPEKGVYVKVTTDAEGNRRSSKVVF